VTAEELFWRLAAELQTEDSRIAEGTIMNGRCLRVGKEFLALGVSREEVCHYVTVVTRLPVDLVEMVEAELDPVRVRRFNLRALLRIARLDSTVEKRTAMAGLLKMGSKAA
jgi:hypothetical protein